MREVEMFAVAPHVHQRTNDAYQRALSRRKRVLEAKTAKLSNGEHEGSRAQPRTMAIGFWPVSWASSAPVSLRTMNLAFWPIAVAICRAMSRRWPKNWMNAVLDACWARATTATR